MRKVPFVCFILTLGLPTASISIRKPDEYSFNYLKVDRDTRLSTAPAAMESSA